MKCYVYGCEVTGVHKKGFMTSLRLNVGFGKYKEMLLPCTKPISKDCKYIKMIKHSYRSEEFYLVDPFNDDPVDSDDLWNYYAHINKIYDGDTVTEAIVDLGFHDFQKTKFRLYGIDTEEMRGSHDKTKAIAAKQLLIDYTLNKKIKIKTQKDKTGKFGRYIATLYTTRGKNINQLLVDEGLAVPYML